MHVDLYNDRKTVVVVVFSVFRHYWFYTRKSLRPAKKLSNGVLSWLCCSLFVFANCRTACHCTRLLPM